MKLVVDRIAAESGERWRTAASRDWESEQDRWVAWLDALTDHDPPPPDAEVLWFEIPSDINPAHTSVSAYAYLMLTCPHFLYQGL